MPDQAISEQVEIRPIQITQTDPAKLERLGLGSERDKWGRITDILNDRMLALTQLSSDSRLHLQAHPQNYKPLDNAEFNLIHSKDRSILLHLWDKMEQVLYGKGFSEVGYHDEAGIAHSELIGFSLLGIIDYPNFEFNRHALEESYLSAFIDPDDRDHIDLNKFSSQALTEQLLADKQGCKSLAYYHVVSKLDWKKLYSYPQMRRAHHQAGDYLRQAIKNQKAVIKKELLDD